MGNSCVKSDAKENKKLTSTQIPTEKKVETSSSNPTQQQKPISSSEVKLNKNPSTQNDAQKQAKLEKQKKNAEVKPNEQNKNKSRLKRQPKDDIERVYFQCCGQEQIMNDQALFDFLGNSLSIEADDIVSGFIIASVMQLKKIEKTPLENFRKLFTYCGASTVQQVKQKLPSLRKTLEDKSQFQKMYSKLFDIYIGDHTTLDLDTASQLWYVYLRGRLKWIKELQDFVEKQENKDNVKVHRDLWTMMLEFSLDVKDIKKDYKEDDFWPTFIQKFVEYLENK